jgi:hypothetical protein
MFGIPPSKIVQVSNPYSPKEILSKFDGKTTAYVAAVGEKDATRLAGKYFKPYKGKTGYGYDEIGYTYIIPADSNPISGTDVRSWLSSDNAEKLFLKAYPKFDKEIYKMITNKLIKEEVTTDTSYVYDPIAEQIAKIVLEADNFIDEYFLEEEPNPIMDKEINYTAADGKKKKITVRGALRLPKDHEAHIQATKLVGPDDAPVNQPKKKEEPNQPGQPVKKGDTEQGKADDKPKGDGGEGGKEQGPPPEQKLKGAELKSDAEDRVSKERKAEELKTALDGEIKSLNKEEQDFIDKGEHKQGSKFMNSLKDGIKKVADTKVVKAIGHVLKHKAEMVSGTYDGVKALASGQKVGSTKNKETGEWEYSDEKRKEQVSHMKHFAKDVALLVASVALGSGLAAGAKALAAGSGLGGAASAVGSGAVGAFTHGAGGFAAHLGKDAIKHVALESLGMGGTQAAVGGAGLAGATMGLLEIRSLVNEQEMDNEKFIQNFVSKMAEKMETYEMNDEQLLQSIKSYKKGKDFGDLVNEVSNVNTANTADVPDGAFIKKNKKRTLDKDKSEAWYKNGGYTQTDFPKADTIFGDDDAEERTIKYTIKNLPDVAYVETEFIKEDINVDVDKGDTVLMGKFKNKKVVVKDFGKDDHGMPTINGKVATTFRLGDKGQNVFKQDENINEIQKGFFKGKMKIGGQAVEVEVELVGVDNKNREFVTKVIGIDKQYQSKLPIGSTLPIPARLFRHGGWAKIKTPSAFNEVHYEDWHYLAIKKLWDKAGTFTRKKIAAVVTKNPNSAWAKIARELRYSDYDEVTDFTDALNLAENVQKKSKAQIVGEFIKFAKERLELESFPDKIKLITDENFPKQVKSFGGYDPQSDEIFVYAGNNRNIVDVVRTLAHELVHLKQRQDGRIGGPEEGATGSDIENEANAAAGILLRDFGRKNEHIYEMAQSNLNAIEKYADSQLSPEDIEFTKHFFDRVNDPRNGKEISDAELTGFFKRLAKHKKEFTDFLNKYKEIVVTDSRSDINIPFVKSANKVIAKTIMRKADFKSSTPKIVNESLLTEGGAYGHMNHPFDISMNLTFGDLKKIINNALDGKLGVVREKTDGQALAISWKNGRLIAARNKGHLANGGANALDMSALASKFGGRGALSDAYNFAMKDLSAAISGLGEKERQSIFKDGSAFCNLEVIYPQNANVIPYGQSLLVFHNVVEYDEKGVAIGGVKGAESKLASMIKQTNAHVQSKYTLQGPPITKLPKDEKLSSQKSKFNGMLSKLQSEFGLADKDGIAEYHYAWWMKFVNNSKKNLSQLEKEGLARRWAFDNKSFGIKSIADEDAKKWADGVDKDAKDKIMKGNIRKFEDIFLGVGAEVLSFMSSVLTAQPDKALQSIKASLESAISDIRNGGSEAQIKRLEKELQRLNAIGGFDKLVPNEGLVFFYKGNTYKLTGTFAPLNQILGIFKFGR